MAFGYAILVARDQHWQAGLTNVRLSQCTIQATKVSAVCAIDDSVADDSEELYGFRIDPAESTNLIDSPSHQNAAAGFASIRPLGTAFGFGFGSSDWILRNQEA